MGQAGGGPSGRGSADAISRYGFALEDVTRKAGIDFVHQAPTLDPALNHIMPEVASAYVDVYAAVSGVSRDRILRWLPFVATARLVESASPEEAEGLLKKHRHEVQPAMISKLEHAVRAARG